MRLFLLFSCFYLLSCGAETDWRPVMVSTSTEILLPADAIYGNLKSFSGMQNAVPDVFVAESVFEVDGHKERRITLSDGTVLKEKMTTINDKERMIHFATDSTSLPVRSMLHEISVEVVAEDRSCKVKWKTNLDTQNINGEIIREKIKGMQEVYLFSLELLGEELEELLNDPDF